jgi:mannose-6-phosphate isomerase-like protein (cupin superfamily)
MYKVDKPWGYEIIWALSSDDGGYVGKHIHINKGHQLSLQYHEQKEEAIYVTKGTLQFVTKGTATHPKEHPTTELLKPGQHREIQTGLIHRFAAGSEAVDLIEVSTKHLDDVVRLQDDYGREEKKD